MVARFLRTGYLWDTVRVMGGAYGGFCRFAPESGVFTFLSYRDPNVKETVDNYDKAAEYLKTLDATDGEVAQAVIGAVGDLDRPMQPDQKGFVSMQQYLAGETAEERQQRRDELLATKLADFKEMGERLEAMRETATATVIGSKAAIEGANEALDQKLTLREIL